MGSELDRDAATFADVARVIAEEEDDVEWLAAGLRSWIWPQERWPESARNFGAGLGMFADLDRVLWPRAQLVKVLKETLPNAANTITNLLRDWALMRFLTTGPLGPGFGDLEQVELGKLLYELRRRCAEASRNPELVSL